MTTFWRPPPGPSFGYLYSLHIEPMEKVLATQISPPKASVNHMLSRTEPYQSKCGHGWGHTQTLELTCTGFHTVDKLNAVFGWSMQSLLSGRAPGSRHDGSPWSAADRRFRLLGVLTAKAALLQCRGDWEWLTQSLRLRHPGNENFCWMCNTSHVGANTFLNVGPDAPWRSTLLTHEQ